MEEKIKGLVKKLSGIVKYYSPLAISPLWFGKIIGDWMYKGKDTDDMRYLKSFGITALLGVSIIGFSNMDIDKQTQNYEGHTISHSSELRFIPMVFPAALLGMDLREEYIGEFLVKLPNEGGTCELYNSKEGVLTDGLNLSQVEVGKTTYKEIGPHLRVDIIDEGREVKKLRNDLSNLTEPTFQSYKENEIGINQEIYEVRQKIENNCKNVANNFIGDSTYKVRK